MTEILAVVFTGVLMFILLIIRGAMTGKLGRMRRKVNRK